jgi:hypothetical protein
VSRLVSIILATRMMRGKVESIERPDQRPVDLRA